MTAPIHSTRCTICRHVERLHIESLLAIGEDAVSVSKRFQVSVDALRRHFKNHASPDLIRAIKLGPFESEERLRALCAQNGETVLQTLKAIYAPLAARYMVAFEAGADQTMISLAGKMRLILRDQAELTQELAPPPASVSLTQNVFMSPGWFESFSRRLVEFARRHPEVRDDLMQLLREDVSAPEQPFLNVTRRDNEAAA